MAFWPSTNNQTKKQESIVEVYFKILMNYKKKQLSKAYNYN